MQLPADHTENPPVAQSPVVGMANNAVSEKDVVPGQSDDSIKSYLHNWMRVHDRELYVAYRIYAGVLGATSPRRGDFPDPEIQRVAYAAWLASCTKTQITILNFARDKKRAKTRDQNKKEYAQSKLAETGEPVRAYVWARSDEDKRALSAAKQKRYRDKLKATGPKPIDPQMADELDTLLVTCPGLPTAKLP